MTGLFIQLIIFVAIIGLILFIFKVFGRYKIFIALAIIFSSDLIFIYSAHGKYDSQFWSIILISGIPASTIIRNMLKTKTIE
ncbi:hypothetical protein [Gottfriedia acidiceleris]|uniref:hypothetical protein n=1 Tax=Gottfriedia acidiceleris TaxID=371036 RepID=UPI003D1D5EAE